MKLVLSAALMAIASAVLYSAPVVSVTCSAPLISSVSSDSTSSANCTSLTNGHSYAGGGASAAANVDLQLATNLSDFNTLTTSQSVYAQQAPRQSINNLFGPSANSLVDVDYSTSLTTSGPVRSGYLQIQAYGVSANVYDGGISMTSGLQFGSGASSYQTQVTCLSNTSYCIPGTGYYTSNSQIPVTLGTSFTLLADGTAYDWATNFDGSSGGSLSTNFRFRFLEADSVTGVQVSQTPEPASVALIGVAFGSLLFARKLRGKLVNRTN